MIFAWVGPLRKALVKQTKAIEDEERKQVKTLKFFKPAEQQLTIKDATIEDQLDQKAENQTGRIKEIERTVYREDILYERKNIHIHF